MRRAALFVATCAAIAAGAAPAGATVIGNGTPAGCTSAAVVAAVAHGGAISFDCGPSDVTIAMMQTAKVVNTSPSVVLDGGGKVTLSGQGARRILYMDTCDRHQGWTTSHCQQQTTPSLVIKSMTFEDGDSAGDGQTGGGAVYAFGGRLTIEHSTFLDNHCASVSGPDVGGGAVAALWQDRSAPVQITDSRFSSNRCDNGGAGGGGGAVFASQNRRAIAGSMFTSNRCPPTGPGGGSGGAIYNDGNTMHLSIVDSTLTDNTANEGGGAIFFVSNDRTGTMSIAGSKLIGNPSKGFETPGLPGIFFLGAHPPTITHSVLKP